MAAIDLLLNWSATSERMHQVVLTGLLRHTRLLELLGVSGKPTALRIETQRRLFDFTVEVENGCESRNVHIELKVDAALSEDQIKRQMAALSEGDLLLYVLIGVTRFAWPPEEMDNLRTNLKEPLREDAVRVIDLDQIREATSALTADAVDENHRDLAVAYGSLLRKIGSKADAFMGKHLMEWERCGHEWFGFYSEMVRRRNLQSAGMGLVNNPAGGFAACWWGKQPIKFSPNCEAYLQCEEELLCFKVAVYEGDRAAVRNRFSTMVLEAAQHLGFTVKRPGRFGSGIWMTVAVMDGDYRGVRRDDFLNWDHLAETITAANTVLDLAVRNSAGSNAG